MSDVAKGIKSFKKDIMKLREKSVFNLGSSGKVGAEYLYKLLNLI